MPGISLKRRSFAPVRVATLLVIPLLCSAALAQSMPIENLAHFPRTTLTISTGSHLHRFKVWIADSPAREAQGLMFVRDLPADEGMIFPMRPPQVAYFWMKNTYIPLDMLFIGTNGRIAKIIANAKPFSLATLSSGVTVEAVVEIRGGEAHRLGLKVGEAVKWASPAGGA